MARTKSSAPTSAQSTATIGFEAKLWLTADKLRNNMDAAEYKHVVLGLIFLKYISDTASKCRMANAEVRTRNARPIPHSKFIIRHLPAPADARWSHLQASAKQPTIGKLLDDAMVAIERDNPRLVAELHAQFAESAKLEAAIRANLKSLNFTP